MRLIHTAVEAIAPGHTYGEQYEIAEGHREALPSFKAFSTVQFPLDRSVREVDYQAQEATWRVESGLIEAGQHLAEWDEFIRSALTGRVFTFDPDSDQLGVDGSPRNVVMVSTSVSRRREGPTKYRYSFQVVEI